MIFMQFIPQKLSHYLSRRQFQFFLLGLIGALQIGFVFVFVGLFMVRYIVTGDEFTVTFNRRHHVRTFFYIGLMIF